MYNAWVSGEENLVDESNFTRHAEPGYSAWNAWSPELEFCEWVVETVKQLQEERGAITVVETGVGQGYVTRRILAALSPESRYIGIEYDSSYYAGIQSHGPVQDNAKIHLGDMDDDDFVKKLGNAFSKADLVVLDSHWPERWPEINLFAYNAKVGTHLYVHDATYSKDMVGTAYWETGHRILRQGIEGEFKPNPRGSFYGVIQEGYQPYETGKVAMTFIYGNMMGETTGCMLAVAFSPWADLIDSIIHRRSGANLPMARNWQVRTFLNETEAEWLWFIDADMGFDVSALSKLLDVAHPTLAPMVGGICFGRNEDGMIWPIAMRFKSDTQTFQRLHTYEYQGLMPVDATGAAFFIVHRSVLEKLNEEYEEPHKWFGLGALEGREISEDILFCMRVRAAGYPIYIDTRVETEHVKTINLNYKRHREWWENNHFVITGSGRNGTGYIAALFNELDVPVGHEEVFHENILLNGDPINWRGWRGDASWMAAFKLEEIKLMRAKIVHLMRDPLKTVASYAKVISNPTWHSYDNPFYTILEPLLGNDPNNLINEAANIVWNLHKRIPKYADITVRVEDLTDPEKLFDFLGQLGMRRDRTAIERAYSQVSETFNTIEPDPISWNDITDEQIRVRLQGLAESHGYL